MTDPRTGGKPYAEMNHRERREWSFSCLVGRAAMTEDQLHELFEEDGAAGQLGAQLQQARYDILSADAAARETLQSSHRQTTEQTERAAAGGVVTSDWFAHYADAMVKATARRQAAVDRYFALHRVLETLRAQA